MAAAVLLAHSYTVRPGDTLSGIAQRQGTTVEALASINGIVDVDRVFAGQTLRLHGSGGSGGSGGGGASAATHIVARGENLTSIARRYGTSVAAIAAANGITNPNQIMAGSRLYIGDGPTPSGSGGSAGGGTHTVRRGETLSGIAARYGVSWSSLARANGITDPRRLQIGQRLQVPGRSGGGSSGGGGATVCPVAGGRFVNDFGVPKPDGRFHEGVDVYAQRGTPVRAPVSGRVQQAEGPRGGLQFYLDGDDGVRYVGTHLDAFGAAGRVRAGDVVGYVGTTGNARGTSPHLHFETLTGGVARNPYPLLRSLC